MTRTEDRHAPAGNGPVLLTGCWATREVTLDGEPLTPAESQALANHSPDGFLWGYDGLGALQLALAVLLRLGPRDVALAHYERFKDDVVARLPQGDFTLRVMLPAEPGR